MDVSEDLERVRRWEDAGGAWAVLSRRAGTLTLALLRCDGGEEVDRVVSSAPDLAEHVGGQERHPA